MATIRLVPSTTAVSNASYASIANANNMYTNTDSTTYGTFTHNRASTSNTYYGYIRGFNFNDVPANAEVSSFTVKIKASATGHTTSTSSSYYMSLINNTTQIGSTAASGRLSTTVTTFTFSHGSLTWDTIVDYGSNFGIRIPLRRASSNTADVVSVYGAEIEVTYTVPNPRTITTTLNGDGTIEPSGTYTGYDGDSYDLVVTPTNQSDTVSATKNGSSIELTQHTGGTGTESKVLGEYELVSGSFNGSGATYFSGLVGKGHDSTQTTSNYYSGSSSSQAVFTYDVPFVDIPSNATITNLYMLVNGHAESTSQSSEYMCARLISGSTNLSDELNFKSVGTSNSTQTVTANVIPTIEQLENLKVQCRLGYYGGAINGATVYLEYEVSGVWYTYSTTISGDMTIVVTIGGGGSSPKIYIKEEGLATLLYTNTNTNSDESIQGYNSYNETLFVNDNIKVVLSNIVAYRSGMARISNFNDTIITTLTSNQNEYVGENEIKVRVYHTSSSNYYQISPYYLYNGYNCTFTGTMSIYKLDSSSGWVQYSKVYKKVNGSWVEQASSTWATLFNTNTNYRKME